MSNQPRGSGPRCDNRIMPAMKPASSERAERIVVVTGEPPRLR
jgi:hypothetical protein